MNNKTLSKTKLWLLAIRPKTLPAAIGPVAVGSALAFSHDTFAALPAICCLLGATLLQVGVNLANDYFDFKNNIDSEERVGPVRVTQSGLIPPQEVKRAMIFTLSLASLVFVYLAITGGLPIVIIGGASVLAALAYSGGPYPLASNGLGELFVFLFFGLVAVCGTYLIQAGQVNVQVIAASIPPGLLITAIMVVNNLRDIDTDSKAGKHTLAVILGRRKTIIEYKSLLTLSYMVPFAMFASGTTVFIFLPLLTLPLAWKLAKNVEKFTGQSLNTLLASTAKLSLFYSLLFSIGFILG